MPQGAGYGRNKISRTTTRKRALVAPGVTPGVKNDPRVYNTRNPRKGGLVKKIAKASGTTRAEAQGVVKTARQAVKHGDKGTARQVIRKSLSGGPSAGVKATPRRSAKAGKTARKVVRRMASKQAPLRAPRSKMTKPGQDVLFAKRKKRRSL